MRILKWTGGIVLALLVALVLFIAFGLSTLKGPITRAVSNATGRELVIDGRLKPVWSWVHPRFRAEKVSFANADWASDQLMFQADAVEASVELLPLLVGRVVLPEVHLNRPIVNIEIDEDGRKNWILKEQDQREGSSRVSIHALTFDQAALHYLDDERDTDLQVAMSTDAGRLLQGDRHLQGTRCQRRGPRRASAGAERYGRCLSPRCHRQDRRHDPQSEGHPHQRGAALGARPRRRPARQDAVGALRRDRRRPARDHALPDARAPGE